MKFVCLGYYDDAAWNALSESERETMMQRCFDYDDELRRGNHIAGGAALQSPDKTVTVRLREGKVVATDGPFIETKEQIGGLLILEAKDQAEAVALMSKHPGCAAGPWEVRPLDETIQRMFEERQALFGK